jgi:hypothetical protein
MEIKKYKTIPSKNLSKAICSEQKNIQNLKRKMDLGLKMLGKNGYVTKRRYYSMEGMNIYLKLEFEGFLNGYRISANTDRHEIDGLEGEKRVYKWTKQKTGDPYMRPYLRIDGIIQPEETRKEFVQTYTPIAYDLDIEKEMEKRIENQQEEIKRRRIEELDMRNAKAILF